MQRGHAQRLRQPAKATLRELVVPELRIVRRLEMGLDYGDAVREIVEAHEFA